MIQDEPKVIDAARWQDIEDETQIDPAKLGYVLAWPYRLSEQLAEYQGAAA